VDVAGKLVGDGIVEQTAKALQNLEAVLTDVGVPVKSIVKVSVFLTSLDHWKEVRGLLDTFFDGHEPARDIPIITPMSLTGALVGFSAIAVGI
jgi:enamine deaminase RidA (YjgF/YER057c/UK114 family)